MFLLNICPVYEYDYYDPFVMEAIDFLSFVGVAAFLAIPIGVFLFLWNNYVPNPPAPHPEVIQLTLDDRPVYFAEAGPSTWIVALYLVTGFVTFSLGVLVSDIVHSFS